MYTTEIKNGVTIISTGDSTGGLKNKTGVVGVTYYKSENRYRAELTIKRKKYLLGFFRDIEDAKAIRKEAEKQKAAGTFFEWYESLEKYKYQKLTKEQKEKMKRKVE